MKSAHILSDYFKIFLWKYNDHASFDLSKLNITALFIVACTGIESRRICAYVHIKGSQGSDFSSSCWMWPDCRGGGRGLALGRGSCPGVRGTQLEVLHSVAGFHLLLLLIIPTSALVGTWEDEIFLWLPKIYGSTLKISNGKQVSNISQLT